MTVGPPLCSCMIHVHCTGMFTAVASWVVWPIMNCSLVHCHTRRYVGAHSEALGMAVIVSKVSSHHMYPLLTASCTCLII